MARGRRAATGREAEGRGEDAPPRDALDAESVPRRAGTGVPTPARVGHRPDDAARGAGDVCAVSRTDTREESVQKYIRINLRMMERSATVAGQFAVDLDSVGSTIEVLATTHTILGV
jgi:hypothetical protein